MRRGHVASAWAAVLLLGATALGFGQGCAGCNQRFVCSLSGPINDPSNRTLRRSLMGFGLDEFCKQMIHRNAPLALAPDQPSIGRFYPKSCRQSEQPNGDLTVDFDGVGYAWTLPTKRMSFFAGAAVTYNQDFQCGDDDAMYAYFPPRLPLSAPRFQRQATEETLTNLLMGALPGVADNVGTGLLRSKLTEGFTVIRYTSGENDFGLGLIPKGQKPPHPYKIDSGDKFTYENNRAEVHSGEHDFVGPILVENDGKAIYVSARLDGPAAGLGVLVMAAEEAEPLLDQYVKADKPVPIQPQQGGPPFAGVARPSMEYRTTVTTVSGRSYYVVLDNSPTINPARWPLDDRVASVSYLIQLGDAP